jgi:hypothetical protein
MAEMGRTPHENVRNEFFPSMARYHGKSHERACRKLTDVTKFHSGDLLTTCMEDACPIWTHKEGCRLAAHNPVGSTEKAQALSVGQREPVSHQPAEHQDACVFLSVQHGTHATDHRRFFRIASTFFREKLFVK